MFTLTGHKPGWFYAFVLWLHLPKITKGQSAHKQCHKKKNKSLQWVWKQKHLPETLETGKGRIFHKKYRVQIFTSIWKVNITGRWNDLWLPGISSSSLFSKNTDNSIFLKSHPQLWRENSNTHLFQEWPRWHMSCSWRWKLSPAKAAVLPRTSAQLPPLSAPLFNRSCP